MSTEPTPAPTPVPPPAPKWEPLSPLARRILGVLVEKQKTSKTADAYPLTLNALVTGCNQKSNRDPVFDLDELEVEEGVEALQARELVTRITGGRADRFRHELYTAWTENGAELAVLAELLLRGPQSKGDLRVRAGRMAAIDSLEALEDVLKPLLERKLVLYLTEPDRRGAVVAHGFHGADELARLRATHAGAPAPLVESAAAAAAPAPRPASAPAAAAAPAPVPDERLATALAELDALKARVAALELQLADLREHIAPPAAG